MQDFHPDCTINLLLQSRGKPGKLAWVCSITTRKSVRLLVARKFLGIVNRDRAEWEALLFGLEQAARWQQEKVAVCANFLFSLDGEGGKARDPEVQSKKAEAEALWHTFRLRKSAQMASEEESFLQSEIEEKVFSRKPRDK